MLKMSSNLNQNRITLRMIPAKHHHMLDTEVSVSRMMLQALLKTVLSHLNVGFHPNKKQLYGTSDKINRENKGIFRITQLC